MSRYSNYAIKNNVFGVLSTPISSLATTIQLEEGQGARFSTNMLATLENIESGKVIHREIVLIAAVSGDVLTVTRKVAPCPSSDEDNSQSQVSFAFTTGDTISAYIDKEHFDEIDRSINDIYDNGVNKLRTEVVNGLQIKVNAGPVMVGSAYYDFAGGNITLTDNATNYIEIDEDGNLVANTTGRTDENTKVAIAIASGGVITSITDWRLGTVGGKIGGVNIHDLTEKFTLSPDDELIVSDSENIWQNKKVKISNILGYDTGICTEDISKGDLIAKQPLLNGALDYPVNLGDISDNSKLGCVVYGSGNQSDNINIYIEKIGSPSDCAVRIETDNNGKPSGTLADENAYGTIKSSDIEYSYTLTGAAGVAQTSFEYDPDGTKTQGGLFMSKDGTKFFLNTSDGVITKYTLSTPFEISTAQQDSVSNVNFGHLSCICFSNDGTKLFAIKYVSQNDTDGKTVLEYDLGTARDITTVNSTPTRVTPPSMNNYTYSMAFSDDGKKLYITADSDYRFYISQGVSHYTYNLSVARDITTLEYVGSASQTSCNIVYITEDGKQAIFYGGAGGTYGYSVWTLTTPFDLTNKTVVGATSNIPTGQIITAQGYHMYGGYPATYVKTIGYSLAPMTINTEYRLLNVQLNGDVILEGGTKYWLVMSSGGIDNSNYFVVGFSKISSFGQMLYNGSSWSILKGEGFGYQPSIGSGSMSANQNFTIYLRPYSTIKMTQCCQKSAPDGTVNINYLNIINTDTSETIYTGTGDSIDITLIGGVKYNITGKYVNGNRYTEYNNESGAYDVGCGKMRGSLMANTAGPTGACWYFKRDVDISIDMCSGLFGDKLLKVDTGQITTFSDVLGVSMSDGVVGNLVKFATNGGVITNNNWHLIPGKNYYCINNEMSDTPTYHTSKVHLGTAISDKALKVDIKVYYYFGPTFDFIVPFVGEVICQNNSTSGGNIKIDGGAAVQTVIEKMGKGQRLQSDGTYYRALTKNR